MTPRPVTLPLDAPLTEAARLMRDENVGDVLVTQDGMLCGLLTDRDIVVRAVAEGRDLTATRLADVCSAGIVTVSPDEAAEVALRLMRDRAVRRLPVVEDGRPVGVVSVGDLTSDRDEASARERAEDTGRNEISEHARRSAPPTLTH
ncbi:oxidoreductase [Actinoallomurus iriomotensis]|uniref:Oxidoreductase n=2 Tax=Actinoallomurus iriomotensis TaxID=478107 RepID=A0A9W6S1Z6_9ACTN|nr:oxidoreductase [Actinoallomurus iriomotensis]